MSSIGWSYDDYLIDGGLMAAVTVWPKFQVEIPKEIRRRLGLLLGQKVKHCRQLP
jgi:bifunctional DNA-binding transcriptional regulator/antitoxin component of YhaV-PrlF toxin-antitoxin module